MGGTTFEINTGFSTDIGDGAAIYANASYLVGIGERLRWQNRREGRVVGSPSCMAAYRDDQRCISWWLLVTAPRGSRCKLDIATTAVTNYRPPRSQVSGTLGKGAMCNAADQSICGERASQLVQSA
ncbi:hypothetical protein C6Y62_11465 [Hyphomicrobium sulfonivorans]|nr:hypothetical protein [Hyphomicrobium sulfonivorans]